MSETMEFYNPIPDTGGTSSASSTLSSPCSNNIIKTDLKSQELDLKDCLLNGDVNSYLPNNNICDENTDISKDDSCDSAECVDGEQAQECYTGQEGDASSVGQSGKLIFVTVFSLYYCLSKYPSTFVTWSLLLQSFYQTRLCFNYCWHYFLLLQRGKPLGHYVMQTVVISGHYLTIGILMKSFGKP